MMALAPALPLPLPLLATLKLSKLALPRLPALWQLLWLLSEPLLLSERPECRELLVLLVPPSSASSRNAASE